MIDPRDDRQVVSKGAGTASHQLFQRAFDLIAKKKDVTPPYFIGVILFGPGVGSDYTWFRSAVPTIDRATGPRCGHLGGFDTPNYGDHFAEFVKNEVDRTQGRLAAIAQMSGVGTNDFIRARCETDFVEYLQLQSPRFPLIVFLTAGSHQRPSLLPLKRAWLASLDARNRLVSVLAEELAAPRIEHAVAALGPRVAPEQWRARFEGMCDSITAHVDAAVTSSDDAASSLAPPTTQRDSHPIETLVTIGRGNRMADNVLRALLEASNHELLASELRKREIANARDDEDAAKNAYKAIKTAYPTITDYVHLRTGGPRGPALYLTRDPSK